MTDIATMTRRILKPVYFVLFVIIYTILFLQTTMVQPLENIFVSKALSTALLVMLLVSALSAIKEYFEKSRSAVLLFGKLAVILVCSQFMMLRGSDELVYALTALLLFAISANLWEEDNLLKTAFYIGLVIVIAFFFLSILGIVENNRGTAFGFVYRTDYACHLLSLAIVWCLIKDGRLTWIGKAGLIILTFYVGFTVGGKTAFICLVMLTVSTLLRDTRYNRIGEILIPKMRYSYIIVGGLSFALALSYPMLQGLWSTLPGLDTFKDRMVYSLLGLQEYPITLFGNNVPQAGAGLSEKYVSLYYFIDNAYIKLAVEYGVAVFIIFIMLMTATMFRLYNEKRYYAMTIIGIFAFSGFMEFEVINVSYNLFFLLSFCKLTKVNRVERYGEQSLRRWSRGNRGGHVIGIVIVISVFTLWSYSAYQISNWRGWTPDYGATIVMTDSSEPCLSRAKYYLSSHQDSAGVVKTEEDKEWLQNQGVDEDRIWVQEFDGVDDLLTNSYTLIKDNNLPTRLTICAPDIQMRRITRCAEAKHIPINSLTFKLHGMDFFRTFASEQWRVLCGE